MERLVPSTHLIVVVVVVVVADSQTRRKHIPPGEKKKKQKKEEQEDDDCWCCHFHDPPRWDPETKHDKLFGKNYSDGDIPVHCCHVDHDDDGDDNYDGMSQMMTISRHGIVKGFEMIFQNETVDQRAHYGVFDTTAEKSSCDDDDDDIA
jgi:hypothetical protein